MSTEGSTRAVVAALLANTGIAITKFLAFLLTGASSMLAEAIHSVADSGNQGLLLVGGRRAQRGATAAHPFGYGRERYIYAFIVAIVLFSVGGLFALYAGWHKIQEPAPVTQPWIAIGVLVFCIVAESISMRACMVEVNKARGNLGLWRWFRSSRQAELVVIFGEDLAALLGLVFALVAIGLTMLTGDPMYDALGTMMIGFLLVLVAQGIARQIKGMLIGQSVEPAKRQDIREFLMARPEIKGIFNLITIQLGSEIMVAVQAEMQDPQATIADTITRINDSEAALKAAFPDVKWIFFEPDDSP